MRYRDPNGQKPEDYVEGFKGLARGTGEGLWNSAKSLFHLATASPEEKGRILARATIAAKNAISEAKDVVIDIAQDPRQRITEGFAGLEMQIDEFLNEASPYEQGRKIGEWTAVAIEAAVMKKAGEKLFGNKSISTVEHTQIDDAVKAIDDFLGENSRAVINQADDLVLISEDGLRKVRFDINNPGRHSGPHSHVEQFIDGEWRKVRIFPTDVPPD